MIDLHSHSLLSDGCLVPAELIQRAAHAGYRGLAITDHADQSNLEFILGSLLPAVRELNLAHPHIKTVAGVEITHVPPVQLALLVQKARALGAQIVVAHGQTISEPVAAGTNLAAIQAGVDILAHPGLLTQEEAKLAAQKGVHLEISARAGHSLTNGLVARMARIAGARLVLNSDAHAPGDLLSRSQAPKIAEGASLNSEEIKAMQINSQTLWQTCLQR